MVACGGITEEQEEKWQKAVAEISQLKESISENIQSASKYYNNIDEEVKNEMQPIDFSEYNVTNDNDISKPEKEREFECAYKTLLLEIEKLNEMKSKMPTIEEIKEEEKAIVDRKEEIRIQEEAREAAERNKLNQGNSIPQNTNSSEASVNEETVAKKTYSRYAEMGLL